MKMHVAALKVPSSKVSSRSPAVITAPAFTVPNGTVEALKWLALFLMTLDHFNKYLLGDTWTGAFALGRLAMPLFGFVLVYNLARPGALECGVYQRTLKRLALFGLLASPFFIALGGLGFGWWPLNIIFMLLVATAVLYLLARPGRGRRVAAVALFVIGGAFVEFWWFALSFCLAAFWYCKTASKVALVVWVLATASLYLVNKNMWALASLPLILLAPWVTIKMPRFRYAFYVYYPTHLAVLLLLSHVLGKQL